MILPSWLNPYVWGGVAIALLLAFFYGIHVESNRFASYRAQVVAVGKMQNKATLDRIAGYKQLKKESEDGYKKRVADMQRTIDRVRRGANSSVLPATTGPAIANARICFDRTELDRAVREFTAEAAGLVAEGDTVRLKMDTAIEWGNKAWAK